MDSPTREEKSLEGIESELAVDYDVHPPVDKRQLQVLEFLSGMLDIASVTFTVGRVPVGGMDIQSGGTVIWSLLREGTDPDSLQKLKSRLEGIKAGAKTPKLGYYPGDHPNHATDHIISDSIKDPSPCPLHMPKQSNQAHGSTHPVHPPKH